MLKEKKSGFFDRLLTTVQEEDEKPKNNRYDDEVEEEVEEAPIKRKSRSVSVDDEDEGYSHKKPQAVSKTQIDYDLSGDDDEEEEVEGELSVDVYQTPTEIIVEAMVAGVKPDDLHIAITRDMITLKGRREGNKEVNHDDYFYKELYFGTFSRTIILPSEVDIEQADAVEKHGLLIIRLPKLDKARQSKIRVKSI